MNKTVCLLLILRTCTAPGEYVQHPRPWVSPTKMVSPSLVSITNVSSAPRIPVAELFKCYYENYVKSLIYYIQHAHYKWLIAIIGCPILGSIIFFDSFISLLLSFFLQNRPKSCLVFQAIYLFLIDNLCFIIISRIRTTMGA